MTGATIQRQQPSEGIRSQSWPRLGGPFGGRTPVCSYTTTGRHRKVAKNRVNTHTECYRGLDDGFPLTWFRLGRRC